jgi:hypothetical protein
MTTLTHTHGTDSSTRRRPPVTVIAASALTALIAAVGAYGAIYFTGKEGWDAAGATFVATYEFITLAGLVSAVAFLRGHALARVGVIVYGIWMTYFTVFKITAIQEWEAIPFGAIALTTLLLATRPSARDYTR